MYLSEISFVAWKKLKTERPFAVFKNDLPLKKLRLYLLCVSVHFKGMNSHFGRANLSECFASLFSRGSTLKERIWAHSFDFRTVQERKNKITKVVCLVKMVEKFTILIRSLWEKLRNNAKFKSHSFKQKASKNSYEKMLLFSWKRFKGWLIIYFMDFSQ